MSDLEDYEWFAVLRRIKENDPQQKVLGVHGDDNYYIISQNRTGMAWEEFGRDIAINTHLTELQLYGGALDDQSLSFLFRGLTRSSSIKCMGLQCNGLSAAAIQSMVPFLQNANNLTELELCNNNIQSEGFNSLFRALQNSPIEELDCSGCGIKTIEIDNEHIPKHLAVLNLKNNNINADGCRRLARLLMKGGAAITSLDISHNQIDDDGVAFLVDALQSNTSLWNLNLSGNDGISTQGKISLLKLIIDISSIKATLQSNHTLTNVKVSDETEMGDNEDEIQYLIDDIAKLRGSPEEAGRQKMIWAQLDNGMRAVLAELQGVKHSVYSEIDTLYLPEVLSLINRHLGREELFVALKSTMTGLLSRVDMKLCLREQVARNEARFENQVALSESRIAEHRKYIAYHEAIIRAILSEHASMIDKHRAKREELNARLATMHDPDDQKMNQDMKPQNTKRRRLDG